VRNFIPPSAGRIVAGLLLSALSAGLLVLAFPPYNLWYLAWFCFVPVVLAQYRILPPKLSGLASAVFNGLWLWGYLGPVFGGSGTFMEYLPLIAAITSFLVDAGVRRFHVRTAWRWLVLQTIACWVGIEMIRLFLPIAGTWGFVAYTLHSQPWLIQPASIFGIFGVSALLILLNHALGLLALHGIDKRFPSPDGELAPSRRLTARWLRIAAATTGAWVVLSLVLFALPQGPSLRVAAIQPSSSPAILSFQSRELAVAGLQQRMVEQTKQAAAEGARVISWPEGALQFDPQVEDRLQLAELARQTGAYLVIGYMVVVSDGVFRNEATVISPEGKFLGVFGKDHPVTFGGETSPTRGTYPVYQMPEAILGTIICYDLDFTDTSRKLARQGAQLIAVPSNDWPGIAYKHYTHVVFRAIENRVAMVKSDGGYDSAIIDPKGRVLALAVYPEGGEATLVADVPLGKANAPAIFLGDWIGWLCLAGLAFFSFAGKWLQKLADRPAGETQT